MVTIAQVVAEFAAEGFTYTGKRTRGRVLRDETAGTYTIQVDDEVRGLSTPSRVYTSETEAKSALIDYWSQCEEALRSSGMPNWKPK